MGFYFFKMIIDGLVEFFLNKCFCRNSQTPKNKKNVFIRPSFSKTCCFQPIEKIRQQYEKKRINVLFIRVIIYYELGVLLILWIMQRKLRNSICGCIANGQN